MGSREMPKYQSHKQVWALKIASVTDPNTDPNAETDGSRILSFEDEGYSTIRVDAEYVRKHNPQPGGYYVVYPDGYKSWSPAKAFEEGYTRSTADRHTRGRAGLIRCAAWEVGQPAPWFELTPAGPWQVVC